jgi:hypothetical protein
MLAASTVAAREREALVKTDRLAMRRFQTTLIWV